MNRSKPRRSARKPGRGVLTIIAGMLIASGMIRLGGEAGLAFATEQDAVVAQSEETEAATCDPETGNAALLEAFQTREMRVSEREIQVEDRLQALRVAEAEIEEKLAQLQAAEAALSDTITVADTAAEDDLGQLTSVYENMKPQDAAALFETMDSDFSAGFIGRMRPEIAAAIMTNLAPETAYAISAILAGRNANVPTE